MRFSNKVLSLLFLYLFKFDMFLIDQVHQLVVFLHGVIELCSEVVPLAGNLVDLIVETVFELFEGNLELLNA